MSDYKVGYGKPPTQSQFTKGKSGNPKGRPKGSKNISTMLIRISNERVTITENGKPLRLSKAEVALRQLVNKSMKGEMRAIDRLLLQLIAVEESLRETQQRSSLSLSPSQAEALQQRLRIQAATMDSSPVQPEDVEPENA
jgi:hypothetical protein